MIPDDVMDNIINVPTEEEAVETLIDELTEEGFVITNFSKGGVFYTLLNICVHVGIQIKELAVDLINSAFMKHCPDDWVEIRAADYSKTRDQGTKTEGYLTITRKDYSNAVKLAKGHPFRTQSDAYGEYLRFYCLEETVLPAGQESTKVLVQAEYVGESYNVAVNTINHSIVHIEGDATVTNEEGWISIQGQEKESIENLRKRCINSRVQVAERTIDRKIKSTAEDVKGVAVASINSQHPRGQGTVDVVITSYQGAASEQLIADVNEAISPLIGCYGDYLVKSAVPVSMPVNIDLYIEKGINTDGISERAKNLITTSLNVANRTDLNVFYRDTLTGTLAGNIQHFCKCIINQPATDMQEDSDHVILAGEITVNVYNVN